MKFLKKYLKFFIGIAVLIFAVVVFFFAMRSSDLENGTLKQWRGADLNRRTAAAQILAASEENLDLLFNVLIKSQHYQNPAKWRYVTRLHCAIPEYR